VYQVDNLGDREEEKLTRMQVRFDRVAKFVDYLVREEESEAKEFDLSRRGGIWAEPFAPAIKEDIEQEIAWIERRLRENRERFGDDDRVEIVGPSSQAGLFLELDEGIIEEVAPGPQGTLFETPQT
jgi:hypothetical protein